MGAADHVRQLKAADTPGRKAEILSGLYFEGANPVQDLKTDGILSVVKDAMGGKYKFRNGASVDVVPIDEVRRGFKDIIFSTYNVQDRNGKHIVGGKKKFERRLNEGLKEVGVKLGGAAAVYGGGTPHSVFDKLGFISMITSIFPFLLVFLDEKGSPDMPGEWPSWLYGLFALLICVFGTCWGLWVSGKALYCAIFKKKTNATNAPAPVNTNLGTNSF